MVNRWRAITQAVNMASWRLPHHHGGLTLIEALLVVVLLGVLVVVLLPIVVGRTHDGNGFNQQECAHNLSHIMGACVAFSTTEEVAWPSPWGKGQDLTAIHIADAHEARLITVHTFSVLAKVMSLPNSVFECPSCSRAGPATGPACDRAGALAWGAGPERAVSYAWDWASPEEPGSGRVVGADRSPANHKGEAMAVFGDSHSRFLKAVSGSAAGMRTEDNDGTPVTTIVGNPDAAGEDGVVDDIYSAVADEGDPLRPGRGGTLRCWVK